MLHGQIAFFLAIAFALSSASPGWTVEPGHSFTTRIETDGDIVIVPVTLGDKTYSFVLDTGASLTVFDNSLKPLLGKPLGEQVIGTLSLPSTIEKFETPPYLVGPFQATHKEPVAVTEMVRFRQITGHNIQGILGMPFLRDFIVQIDFDQGSLVLSRALPDQGNSKPIQIPMSFNRGGLPMISGRVMDTDRALDVSFQVDTGAGGVALNLALFQHLLEQKQVQIVGKTISSDLGSDRWDYKGRVSSLMLDKYEHQDVLVSHTFSPRQPSVLGLSYLSRYKVTFDFPNQTLRLEPGKQFRKRLEPNRSGIRMLRLGEDMQVVSVDEGSPAEKADIQAGDLILQINKFDARKSTPFVLRNELDARPGAEFTLVLSRDGKTFEQKLSIPLFDRIANGR